MLKSRLMKRLLFILILAVGYTAAAAGTQEVDNKAYFLCKRKKQVRTIRVHINHDGICGTFYSKDGDEKMVGSGKAEQSCMNWLNNIKTNLEKSNWTCRDISDTKITAGVG